jgi:chromosome segregation ATPase
MKDTIEDISKKLVKMKEANREAREKKASLEGRKSSIEEELKSKFDLAPEDVEGEIDSLQSKQIALEEKINKEFNKLVGEGK